MVAEASILRTLGRASARVLAALLVAALIAVVPLTRPRTTTMTLLVPAYFYPAGAGAEDWDRLADAAETGPVQAIVNPANGPGKRPDPKYVSAVRKLRGAGVQVLGYVHTSYGKRALDAVKGDVRAFLDFYDVDGFFVDEMSSDPERVPYYASLYTFIKRRDPAFAVVANPGTTPDEAYAKTRTADTLIVFEGPAAQFRVYEAPAWASRYPRARFGHIVYDAPTEPDMRALLSRSARNGAGSIFIGDGRGSNPYSGLPPYWDQEAEARKAVP